MKFFLNFFFFFLCVFTPNLTASVCKLNNDVIIYEMNELKPIKGLDSIEVTEQELIQPVPDPHSKNDFAVKFKIKHDSFLNKGFRSEAVIKDYIYGNILYSYSFEIFIPTSFVSDTQWNILAQWHDQPDKLAGQTWHTYPSNPPPLALLIDDFKLYMIYRPNVGAKIKSLQYSIDPGTWNKIQFNILWSLDEDGFIVAYLNGKPFLSKEGSSKFSGQNIYNKAGNYFKFGIYRGSGSSFENEVYFKNLIITASCLPS